MIRKFWMLLFVSVLGLSLVNCSSNEKKGEETSSESGSAGDESGFSDGETSESGITFNPNGSDSGSIDGLNTVGFGYDKANLTSSARSKLAKNAEWIKSNPGANIQIEGHCDERGSIEYNLSLGERRANAVKRYLVSLGVSSKRLSVISYGKEKLLDTGDSEAAHARNRRANFLPIPR